MARHHYLKRLPSLVPSGIGWPLLVCTLAQRKGSEVSESGRGGGAPLAVPPSTRSPLRKLPGSSYCTTTTELDDSRSHAAVWLVAPHKWAVLVDVIKRGLVFPTANYYPQRNGQGTNKFPFARLFQGAQLVDSAEFLGGLKGRHTVSKDRQIELGVNGFL